MDSEQREWIDVQMPVGKTINEKMRRKGMKCWARELESVDAQATSGHAYKGEYVQPGVVRRMLVGAVVIHVDEADLAKLGVVVVNSKSIGIIRWIEHCAPGAWVSSFAQKSRQLLSMEWSGRVRVAVSNIVSANEANKAAGVGMDLETEAYWRELAGTPEDSPEEQLLWLVSTVRILHGEPFWDLCRILLRDDEVLRLRRVLGI